MLLKIKILYYCRTFLVVTLLYSTIYCFGQGDSISTLKPTDSLLCKKKWEVIPLPVLSYSSDLGFSFGTFTTFNLFGKKSSYPNYEHHFEVLLRYNTNVSGIGQILYDSKYLIPNLRATFYATYALDKMFPFYGFNGYESPYFCDNNYYFYSYKRNQIKATFDLQKKIIGNLKLIGGVSFYHYEINSAHSNSLYDLYLKNNIFSSNELSGGKFLCAKTGLFYDSRDSETNPSKGTATELILLGSPDVFTNWEFSHIQLSFIHRHFITIIPKHLILAYRFAYQGILAGEMPFYALQNLHSISQTKTYYDGVGGETSVRGILPNRVIGKGVFWLNIEPRIHLVNFTLLNQQISIVTNPFFDCGMVTQKYKNLELRETLSTNHPLIGNSEENLHKTMGIGVKLILNQNLVLGAEVGFALDKQDGISGIYVGTNYSF